MLGNVMFFIMIIFQLSGALILLIGNLRIDKVETNKNMIFGPKEKVDEVAFFNAFNAYKSAYSNAAAGMFLIIGYTACIFENLKWKIQGKYAFIIIVASISFSYLTFGLIVKLSKNMAKRHPKLDDNTVWIGDE